METINACLTQNLSGCLTIYLGSLPLGKLRMSET